MFGDRSREWSQQTRVLLTWKNRQIVTDSIFSMLLLFKNIVKILLLHAFCILTDL